MSRNRYMLGLIRNNFIHLLSATRSITKVTPILRKQMKLGLDQGEYKLMLTSIYTHDGRINEFHEMLVRPYEHSEQQRLMNRRQHWNRPPYYNDDLYDSPHSIGYGQERLQ